MTSSAEKLRYAFKMYDKDSSGNKNFSFVVHLFVVGMIELDEMMGIVGMMFELQGFTTVM